MDDEAWSIGLYADRDGVREVKPISSFSRCKAGSQAEVLTACFGLAARPWWMRVGCVVLVILMRVDDVSVAAESWKDCGSIYTVVRGLARFWCDVNVTACERALQFMKARARSEL
jgi:hypothetical protein